VEPYPAATALADLDDVGRDQGAATRVLARFAVLQLVIQADAGVLAGEALSSDRQMALGYLADSSAFSAGERQALGSVLREASASPVPALPHALLAAGAAAELRGHGAGAWAYYRTAYQIAHAQGWAAEGAAAARAVAALAAAGGGTRSVRLWRRRAQASERRAHRSI
jgi:hypothetical protein